NKHNALISRGQAKVPPPLGKGGVYFAAALFGGLIRCTATF
ncbi:MAG: hypothetical protein ACI9GE_000809, partial [Oceanospirillaceae bacterium]